MSSKGQMGFRGSGKFWRHTA